VLADDNSQILSLVSRVLGGHCEIVGEAMDGEQAIEMTLRQQPDILVLDISMPRLNGIEVARRLAECGSTARIVFLTSLEDSEYVAAALRLGVHGFVSKKLLHKDLATAITTAIEGGTFYSRIPSHAPAAVFLDATTSDLDLLRQNDPAGLSSRSIFSPGETAPFSGVYLVIHGPCRAETHYVSVIHGDIFPACSKCTLAVRFELRFSAVHIKSHSLFQKEG